MTNEFASYKEYARNHLPDGMTFNGGFYWYNNHKFGNYDQAIWYYNYLHKYVYSQVGENVTKQPNGFWAGGFIPFEKTLELILRDDPAGFLMDLNKEYLA